MVSPPRLATTLDFFFRCAFFFAISPGVGKRVRREGAGDDQPHLIVARGALDGIAISEGSPARHDMIDRPHAATLLDAFVFDITPNDAANRLEFRHRPRPGTNLAPPLQIFRTLSRLVRGSDPRTTRYRGLTPVRLAEGVC